MYHVFFYAYNIMYLTKYSQYILKYVQNMQSVATAENSTNGKSRF